MASQSTSPRPGSSSGRIDTGIRIKNTDPRPLHDPEWQKSTTRHIQEFLRDLNCKAAVNTCDGFWKAVGAACREIIPDYQVNDKENGPDRKLVSLLQTLKYPYRINTQALAHPGVMTSLPTQLGVLQWLVNLAAEIQVARAHVQKAKARQPLNNYMLKAYRRFMNDRTYDKARAHMVEVIQQQSSDTQDRIDTLCDEIKALRAEKRRRKKIGPVIKGLETEVTNLFGRVKGLREATAHLPAYVEPVEEQPPVRPTSPCVHPAVVAETCETTELGATLLNIAIDLEATVSVCTYEAKQTFADRLELQEQGIIAAEQALLADHQNFSTLIQNLS